MTRRQRKSVPPGAPTVKAPEPRGHLTVHGAPGERWMVYKPGIRVGSIVLHVDERGNERLALVRGVEDGLLVLSVKRIANKDSELRGVAWSERKRPGCATYRKGWWLK